MKCILWITSCFFFSIDSKCDRTVWFYYQVILVIWGFKLMPQFPQHLLASHGTKYQKNKTNGSCGWILGSSILVFFSSFQTLIMKNSGVSFLFLCFLCAFFPHFWGFLDSCSVVQMCCWNSKTCFLRFLASKECHFTESIWYFAYCALEW